MPAKLQTCWRRSTRAASLWSPARRPGLLWSSCWRFTSPPGVTALSAWLAELSLSGWLAQLSGWLAQLSGWLAQLLGWLAQLSGWLAQLSGWLAQLSGWLAQLLGWLAQLSGWLAQLSGWLAQLLGWLAQLSGWLAQLDLPARAGRSVRCAHQLESPPAVFSCNGGLLTLRDGVYDVLKLGTVGRDGEVG